MKPRTRILLGAAAFLLLIPLGLSGLTAASLLQMLHLPRNSVADIPGSAPVHIQARDGVTLEAEWIEGPTHDCVLFLHGVRGWRGRAHRVLPWLEDYSVLAPDLRGHGESGGDTITYGLLEQYDALDWAKWMRAQGCARVYGMGESLGASILIMAAGVDPAQRPFDAIVAQSAFSDLLDAAKVRGARLLPLPPSLANALAGFAVWGGNIYAHATTGFDFSQSRPVDSIAQLTTPILLIHGLADNRTPPSHSQQLAAANPAHTELWMVPRARHVDVYETAPDEYRTRVLDFLARHP